jgi:hypothetical protein
LRPDPTSVLLAAAELIRSAGVVRRSARQKGLARFTRDPKRREVMMASQGTQPATNERILQLVQQVQADLADSKKRELQIARDLKRLLDRN